MSQKIKLMSGIINPFSDEFLITWDLWKQYKKEEFGFQYKGCVSEQTALMQLKILANGSEERAVAIITQSIANTWKGLFQIKENSNGNTESKQSVRAGVQAEFNNRYAKSG
jgi:hypothetical protein